MTENLRIVFTGGGTGGHVFPALAVARELRRLDPAAELLWIGQADSLEQRTATAEGIAFTAVQVGKIRRDRRVSAMLSRANLTDMARVPVGVAQAARALRQFAPAAVLATGGYVAVPVGLAARMLRVPLVVHEQTVGLGLANRVLASGARTVAVTSEATLARLGERERARAVVTGNPVRAAILEGDRARALTEFGAGFAPGLPTVYVTGGAQGSQQINTAVADLLEWMLGHANVIHQAGPANVEAIRAAAAGLPPTLAGRYQVIGFVAGDLVADVLALADVVISRSGAGTLAELTALGRAAVLLPLASSAGGEQAAAARMLDEAGAAAAVLGEITGGSVRTALEPLLANPVHRRAVAERARALGRPDAAAALTRVVLQAAGAVPTPV